MEEEMDLHNNAVGRIYFLNLLGKNEAEIIHYISIKMKSAQKVSKIEEMKSYRIEMVFIEG